jgi:NhaP-type Na+/H+ or K+/H+ antiporter
MRASIHDLAAAWKLPGRALLFGLPLTLCGTALLAHMLAGIPWLPALLVGAILCPTDPVFAAAIVGREEIPARLRFLLNVESGINDGLALPIVLGLLAIVGHGEVASLRLGGELLWGIALGVILPWALCRLHRTPLFGIAKPYEPLFAFAVGLLTLSIAALTHGNIYLAAFAAGVTLTSVEPELRAEFHQFGELIAELLKLAALLVFGAMLAPHYFIGIGLGGYTFALLAVILARPLALLVSLAGSTLSWQEQITAAWFGPKGFASVIYGFLLLNAAVPDAEHLFHLLAIVIAISMIAHSSTDVLLARWFSENKPPRSG